MITFFRKIRQKLLSQNRVTQYLTYAIGEVALVMIGILLALQVNNWNETRKQKETTNSIYFIVKEDLINDISEIDSFLKYYEEIKSEYNETKNLIFINQTGIWILDKNDKEKNIIKRLI